MHSFKDKEGRQWDISLTYGYAKRAKARLGVNMLEPENDNTIGRIVASAELMAEAIALALEPQFEQRGLTAEDVLEAFDGKAMSAARDAFIEEWEDFFLASRQPHRAAATQRTGEGWTAAMAEAERRIKDYDIKTEVLKNMSGDAPDESA